MEKKIKPYFIYEVTIYSITTALNKMKDYGIKIYQLKKEGEYTYSFISSIYTKSRLVKLFPTIQIKKQIGLLSIFLHLFQYKTTLLAMILSIAFYFRCTSKIWSVEITGDSDSLIPLVEYSLEKYEVCVGKSIVNKDELSEIQNKILYENYDEIEYIVLKKKGCKILVNFLKKRKINTPIELKGNIYAKRDGIIYAFDVLSGEKNVRINDYVKKDDLLVKEVIMTDYNQEVYIGTYGSVYAYTWYYINLNTTTCLQNHEEIFANFLMEGRKQISKNFKEKEEIVEENVLQFEQVGTKIIMKIHYTCIEDIARSD